MPSPRYRPKSTDAALTLSTSRPALRSGDLSISKSMPYGENNLNQPGSAPANMNTFPSTSPTLDASQPRKSTPPHSHGRGSSKATTDFDHPNRASMVPSSMSSVPSKSSLQQKKEDSGLRATLRRMFGSKRQRSSIAMRPKDFLISDPGHLTSAMDQQPGLGAGHLFSQSGRSTSQLSIPQSRSPPTAQSKTPRSSYEHNKPKSPRRRRRNTLPSIVLNDQDAQKLASPDDEYATRAWNQVVEPTENNLKRRSRSADALNEIISDNRLNTPAKTMNRESEISYWRNSIIDNPVPMFKCYSQHENNIREAQCHTRNPSATTALQPFDFGLERPEGEAATIEQRVNTLEVKMFDFEFALAKIQGNDVPKPILYTQPMRRRSVHDIFPDSKIVSTEKSARSQRGTFLSSSETSPNPTIEKDNSAYTGRSSYTTTIRPPKNRQTSAAPSPTPPSRISRKEYQELKNVVEQERKARQNLERQLMELQKEIEILRTPVYAEIRPLAYPTPSPESFQDNPLTQRVLHRAPNFQLDRNVHETSRFSMTDAGSETEDTYEDEDVYGTPRENIFTFDSNRGSPVVGAR